MVYSTDRSKAVVPVLVLLFGALCLGRAAVCDCGSPWTFLLPFSDCDTPWTFLLPFLDNIINYFSIICVTNTLETYIIPFYIVIYNKRQNNYLWKQRTHYGSENGSLCFTETLHKQ